MWYSRQTHDWTREQIRAGVSVRAIAEEIGVSVGAVRNWSVDERGRPVRRARAPRPLLTAAQRAAISGAWR